MSVLKSTAASILCLTLAGCLGSDGGVLSVTGTVTQNDKPLPGAVVDFIATGATPGLGGYATTGADGTYTIVGKRGEKGLAPGSYKVTVSLRLRPDGSPADPNTSPIESDATERLPPIYSDAKATTLTAQVDKDARVHDFKVEAITKGR
jgi:hypothetical protein